MFDKFKKIKVPLYLNKKTGQVSVTFPKKEIRVPASKKITLYIPLRKQKW